MKQFLRFAGLALAGATAMVLSLLWVAQFFTGDEETTPVIRLENINNKPASKRDDDSFAEWQE
jgi:hypothetical protein